MSTPFPRKERGESVVRWLYSLALYLLSPFTLYHLVSRGFRVREYFRRWDERYAAYSTEQGRPCVWLHAVSVGEVNAAAPLVNALLRQGKGTRWVVTTITPTGSQRVRALWGERVDHVYLPYDLPGSVDRFLQHFRPTVALIMETELWPNMLFGCRDHRIPVYVLNARLSARSLRGYRLLRPLLGRALRTVRCVAAQSAADARRFQVLGARADQVRVLGNLKYDVEVPDGLGALRSAFADALGRPRPVWIAASTHEGEEEAVLALHRRLRARWPDLLLLWAPRHPERFGRVQAQAAAAGWQVGTRSRGGWPAAGDEVFVVDTLGELMAFYACADVAFVGGSLQPVGGHNLLEPAAVGTAIVTGPHLHNFAEVSRRLDEAGALRVGQDLNEVGDALEALLGDPGLRQAMVAAGLGLVDQGRGALRRTLELIAPDLPAPDPVED
ncbi:lipid IV(A) 3-deoxy-D-manno-octulosonic acid transferase [Pseudoxanthomonas suwonensis]|uniref:lipid IV(A) 3-deoxy-D-manno-octulosonic acid transferase n=1 Tax=Pseudoxanthomonas suwonensis TaxID=314722 RepID=UPI00138EE6F2|nr:lipid IV(A) 3-deoxy-D-manno-octulosonic acid transferase [Pseudoxanthomonas suwonensis]KAF1705731.1 3-deoxy-D-manno-octulosonic acid transferase [Pseudoxanthomonas suwonensis]